MKITTSWKRTLQKQVQGGIILLFIGLQSGFSQSSEMVQPARSAASMRFCYLVGFLFTMTSVSPAVPRDMGENISSVAIDIYKSMVVDTENLFLCPYSISSCLAVLHAGAKESTKTELADFLGLEGKGEDLNTYYSYMNSSFKVITKSGLSSIRSSYGTHKVQTAALLHPELDDCPRYSVFSSLGGPGLDKDDIIPGHIRDDPNRHCGNKAGSPGKTQDRQLLSPIVRILMMYFCDYKIRPTMEGPCSEHRQISQLEHAFEKARNAFVTYWDGFQLAD